MTDLNVIKDTAEALSKPFVKLIKLGERFLDPFHIRKRADAERYAALQAVRSEIEIEEIKDEANYQRAQRAFARSIALEMARQDRLEAVFQKAQNYLPAIVSDQPVDDSWAGTLIDSAKDASEESIQDIFARLLAAEVAQPGTTSKRTLRIVRDMSPLDAQVFVRALRVAVRVGNGTWIPRAAHSALPVGFATEDLLRLGDCGLLVVQPVLTTFPQPETIALPSGRIFRLTPPSAQVNSLYCQMFTNSAVELANTLSLQIPIEADAAVEDVFRDLGFRLTPE